MLTEYMAECPYCGQMVALNGLDGMYDEEQKEAAGRKCTCTEANRQRRIRESNERIAIVCGAASIDNGFEYPLSDAAIDTLKRIALDIIDGHLDRATLKVMGGDEVRLTDAIAFVKVKRTSKKQMEM